MKTMAALYGGDSNSCKDICSGDILTVELLDTAFALLLGNDYLKNLKRKNNQIMIKMSNLQYKGLQINNLSLLFVNCYNNDNITLYNDNIDMSGKVWKDNRGTNFVRKAVVSLKNKQVEIFTVV